MSPPPFPASPELPEPPGQSSPDGGTRWNRLERLADRFEESWGRSGAQTIEATLAGVSTEDRLELLHALIAVEADQRRKVGERPVPAEYLGRFDELLTEDGVQGAPVLTEEDVRNLLVPHLPTTLCPQDRTMNEGSSYAAAVRVSRGANDPPALPPHLQVERKYGANGLLGRGGMGAVWAARDFRQLTDSKRPRPGRLVAVKALLPGAAANSQLLSRFAREAAILHKFGDPAVPRFYEYRPPSAQADAHIITDLVVGETFERLLDSRRQSGRAGCDDRGAGNGRLRMFRKAVAAVARGHAVGLIHRDLKPSNMMVRIPDEQGRRRVFLLDYGMAYMPGLPSDPCDENGRLASLVLDDLADDGSDFLGNGDARLNDPVISQTETDRLGFTVIDVETADQPSRPSTGDDDFDDSPPAVPPRPLGATRALDGRTAARTLIGSLPYMAPEQARRRRVRATADVYSLGLILVEILTGEQARDVSEADAVIEKARNGDIAAAMDRLDLCAARSELIELALRCVRYDPRRRPADAGELLRELDALSVRDPKSGARAWDPRTVARSRGRRFFVAAARGRFRAAGGSKSAPSPCAWLKAAAETLFGPPRRKSC
ncbi:serine/threonine-protein kinase [Alienimonas californiensis]|uniref:Serine/threonine-protein kinase PknA n=1 Tax=Alienimonas californiensis TaxID=2527989 RepID=A0A517PAV1_9PLAN|nr:serine/threonine-protein kinase [Alienimonas californiensis]QDT16481.1 Serine/threonine-protein kinase PknA [Alienimonas californiensis]